MILADLSSLFLIYINIPSVKKSELIENEIVPKFS